MPRTEQEQALPKIFTVRGKKVVFDSDLAKLYGVPTSRLNEAVKRNAARFPEDFSFYLKPEEHGVLISQNAISRFENPAVLKSHSATSKTKPGGRRKPARVFTEHGALMVANVLRSERAIEMSVYLIRAFVEIRDTLQTNATILKRLAEIDRPLIEHDSVLREVIQRLQPLLDAPEEEDEVKPKIGFHPGNR
jgi:hypothetical protein